MTYKLKVCQKCGQEYQPTGGHQKWCSACVTEYDPERNAATQRRFYLVHPGCRREEKAIYYTDHREEQLERVSQWALTPKGRAYRQKHNHERRALGILDLGAFYAKCALLQWSCQLCGTILTEKTVSIDHIIPVIKGGTNDIDNLQPLCQPCNGRKFTRSMAEILRFIEPVTSHVQ